MIMAGLLRLSRPPPVTRSSMLVVVRRIGPFLTGGVPALHAQDTQLARSREGTVVRHQRAGTDRQCSRRLHRIRQLQPANGAKPSCTFFNLRIQIHDEPRFERSPSGCMVDRGQGLRRAHAEQRHKLDPTVVGGGKPCDLQEEGQQRRPGVLPPRGPVVRSANCQAHGLRRPLGSVHRPRSALR